MGAKKKKDAKKGGGGGDGALDAEQFTRQGVPVPTAPEDAEPTVGTEPEGHPVPLDSLIPTWDIDEEDWHAEDFEDPTEIHFPAHMEELVASWQRAKTLMPARPASELEDPENAGDDKGKGKAKGKGKGGGGKGGADEVDQWMELEYDPEDHSIRPKMVIGVEPDTAAGAEGGDGAATEEDAEAKEDEGPKVMKDVWSTSDRAILRDFDRYWSPVQQLARARRDARAERQAARQASLSAAETRVADATAKLQECEQAVEASKAQQVNEDGEEGTSNEGDESGNAPPTPDPEAVEAMLQAKRDAAEANEALTQARNAAEEEAERDEEERANDAEINIEEPEGERRDAVMAQVVRLIERFAGSLPVGDTLSRAEGREEDGETAAQGDVAGAGDATDSSPFLWNSIYPQTQDGRPSYNPAGKYCVKVFVAGAWRKVVVDDRIPVDANGESILLRSIHPRELWPTLLAKAVYKVYTLCGYHRSCSALVDGSASDVSDEPGSSRSAASCNSVSNSSAGVSAGLSHFTNFTLHTLTGWLPTPAQRMPRVTESIAAPNGLVAKALLSQAVFITHESVPSQKPILAKATDSTTKRRQRSRRIRREKRMREQQEARDFEDSILVREAHIRRLDAGVAQTRRSLLVLAVTEWDSHEVASMLAELHQAEQQEELEQQQQQQQLAEDAADTKVAEAADCAESDGNDTGDGKQEVEAVSDDMTVNSADGGATEQKQVSPITPQTAPRLPPDVPVVRALNRQAAKLRLYPILAVSASLGTDDCTTVVPQTARVLVSWKALEPVQQPPPTTEKDCTPRYQFSASTPIESSWVPVRHLLKLQAELLEFQTRTDLPFTATMHQHWTPAVVEEEDNAGKGGGKGGKGARDDNPDDAEPVPLRHPGHLHPSYLMLEPVPEADRRRRVAFADQVAEADAGGNKVGKVGAEAEEKVQEAGGSPTETSEPTSMTDATAEADSLRGGSDSEVEAGSGTDGEGGRRSTGPRLVAGGPVNRPIPHIEEPVHVDPIDGVRLTVLVWCDVDNMALDKANEATLGGGGRCSTMQQDTELVLREIPAPAASREGGATSVYKPGGSSSSPPLSGDGVNASSLPVVAANPHAATPLCLRVHVSRDASMPYTAVPLTLPHSDMPRLFRISLTTGSGCYCSVASEARVAVGEAGDVWRRNGGTWIAEDNLWEQAIPRGLDQVVGRRLIQFADADGDADASANLRFFLAIRNPAFHQYIRAVLIDNKTGDACRFSALDGSVVLPAAVNGEWGHSLIVLARRDDNELPPFAWGLHMLSDRPVVDDALQAVSTECVQRFSGFYEPNHELTVFRDSITAEEYPLTCRVSVPSAPSGNGGQDVRLRADVIHQASGQVYRTVRARTQLNLWHLPNPSTATFPDSGDEQVRAPNDNDGEERNRWVVHVRLDEERMEIPEEWRSRRPYYFRRTPVGMLSAEDAEAEPDDDEESKNPDRLGGLPQPSDLQWTVDLVSGANVTFQHDLSTLEQHLKIRTAWEEAEAGRAERAAAARALFLRQQQGKEQEAAADGVDEEEFDMRVNVLVMPDVEEDKVRARLQRRVRLGPCVTSLRPGSSFSKSSSVAGYVFSVEEEKERQAERAATIAASTAVVNGLRQALDDENDELRKHLAGRSVATKQARDADLAVRAEQFSAREEYRVAQEKRANAVQQLILQGRAAIRTAMEAEEEAANAAADPKKKKKK